MISKDVVAAGGIEVDAVGAVALSVAIFVAIGKIIRDGITVAGQIEKNPCPGVIVGGIARDGVAA